VKAGERETTEHGAGTGPKSFSSGEGLDVPLPILNRFRCLSSGGLGIVYECGAVLWSAIERFDGSGNLGTIPVSAIIPGVDVLVRALRISCG
jgi:hypothetical protein